jgi:DnaJ-class molecular chaperone
VTTLIGIGIVMILCLSYAGSCWIFPLARCTRCKGSGRRARADGKVWRDCRRCKGSGRRFRAGRKIWNYFHHMTS